jgi:hypothetical protein
MSFPICQYHGMISTAYRSEIEHSSIFSIKREQDLTELVRNALISYQNQDDLKADTDLNSRNIFLIYTVLPGGGRYCIKNINSHYPNIEVKVVYMNCPYLFGTCALGAKFYVLSTPKTYERENLKISCETLDIYSEAEFDGFENFIELDKKIEEAYLTLDEDTQELTLNSYYQNEAVEALSEESWFNSLSHDQKEIIRKYREALILRDEKYKKISEEKRQVAEFDCIRRYSELCQRLKTPIIS